MVLVATLFAAGLLVLFFIRARYQGERPTQFFANSAQLTEAALSWIPFQKELLVGATDIALTTDVDTNQFLIQWKFLDLESALAFQEATEKAGSPRREITCGESGPAECAEMKIAEGKLSRFDVDKSIWLLDLASLRIRGSTEMPVPESMK